MKEWMSWFI